MFGCMAASFLAVSLSAPDATRWTLLLSIGVGGASAGGMALPALCAYLFPARQLSSAIGMGVMVARLGAFAGPLVGQAILDADAGPQAFFFAAAVPGCFVRAGRSRRSPPALAVRKREEMRA
jgi:MFS family permease